MNSIRLSVLFTIFLTVLLAAQFAYAIDDSTRNILKQGLLGAGVGAISAEASGGKAGQGALIGAGTSIIGSALLDALTEPSSSSGRRRSAPPPDQYYDDDQSGDEYYEEYYEEPPQESGSTKILKQGLLGAGVGAISASASGGKAGQGALIGAGTSVIGNALLDTLTQPSEQRRRVYRRPRRTAPPPQQYQQQQYDDTTSDGTTHKKVIRKYDANGKVVSEEEIYY